MSVHVVQAAFCATSPAPPFSVLQSRSNACAAAGTAITSPHPTSPLSHPSSSVPRGLYVTHNAAAHSPSLYCRHTPRTEKKRKNKRKQAEHLPPRLSRNLSEAEFSGGCAYLDCSRPHAQGHYGGFALDTRAQARRDTVRLSSRLHPSRHRLAPLWSPSRVFVSLLFLRASSSGARTAFCWRLDCFE